MSSAGSSDFAGTNRPPELGRKFPCESCGADFEFHIGQQQLRCPYCGFTKELEQREARVEEQDLLARLDTQATRRGEGTTAALGDSEVHCDSCGSTVAFVGNLTSKECAYCGSPIQVAGVHASTKRVPVDGMLPFMVKRDRAKVNLRAWVKSRWFAPNAFKRRGVSGKFSGMYFPYWTYDAMTFTRYSGERGEYYYVEVGSGQNRTRQRRTRWYPASGSFQQFFDDVLVCAAHKLEQDLMRGLEPWPLEQTVPFNPEMLAGYLAMTYDLALDGGFGIAKERMEEEIHRLAERDIGGDTQRIHSISSSYSALTYKHMLLPVWMLAYRFKEKSYQVVVNACTGEVEGERPWSWIKIAFASLLAAIVLALGAWVFYG